MKLVIFAVLFAVCLSGVSLAEGRFIARKDYPGPCACPDDVAKNGSKCGKRSAFCKCNGFEPLGCYAGDDDPKQRSGGRASFEARSARTSG
jgi:hypothetical protein